MVMVEYLQDIRGDKFEISDGNKFLAEAKWNLLRKAMDFCKEYIVAYQRDNFCPGV